MEPLQGALVIVYVLITSYFFTNWLKFFRRSPKLSIEERFLSHIILVIATILWPFVVPISFVEFLKAGKLQLGSVMPVVLAMFLVSLITLPALAAFDGTVPQAFSYLLTYSRVPQVSVLSSSFNRYELRESLEEIKHPCRTNR